MKRCTPRLGAALTALSVLALGATTASADVPSFSRCPVGAPNLSSCLVAQSTGGSIGANRNSVNVGTSVKIEGGVAQDPDTHQFTFVPPASGPALTGTPVVVSNNLFGTGLPFSLNTLTAQIQQVGAITYDYSTFSFTAPIRIKFSNPLLGTNCAIGSTAAPITLNLTTDITDPPPPNQPIFGDQGSISRPAGLILESDDVIDVDNAYAVPAASNCGAVAPATVTKAINKQLGLPSPAGTNTATITNNVYVGHTPS
ncbi:hypothetical protein [Conexibacter woesei]|uniref:hypothetical protein n=1 Tax=Conexibacter woesei TaxID=191495 RepID=UPI00040B79C8|nr:hypothetical protein [Conexibacter woesei]